MTDRRLRILICEDDERLATLVTETLAADGRFDVVARATNGEDAIRLAEEHGPDVVLMDIGLPGVDGIDATRAIRERDAGQHVVIYTGSAEYEDIGRADAVGAAGFLHKDALTSPDLPDAIEVLHTNFASVRTDPD
ncbi:MAG TPA: response regulator transcription factor [Gaiellaceae bacterium]|nr:response regulator transcription factor [Gaiellaceae bacterium]